jgi:hypothetical protein
MTHDSAIFAVRLCNFPTGKSGPLWPAHKQELDKIVELARQNPGQFLKVAVIGRASRINRSGLGSLNLSLSRDRCYAIEVYILEKGVANVIFLPHRPEGSKEADAIHRSAMNNDGRDRAVEVVVSRSTVPPPQKKKETFVKGFGFGIANFVMRVGAVIPLLPKLPSGPPGPPGSPIPVPVPVKDEVVKRLLKLLEGLKLPPDLKKFVIDGRVDQLLEVTNLGISRWRGDFRIKDNQDRKQADFDFEAFAIEMGGSSKIPFVGLGIFRNAGFTQLIATSTVAPLEVFDFGGFGAELQFGIEPTSGDNFLCHHFSQKRFEKGGMIATPIFKVPFSNTVPLVTGPPLFTAMRGSLTLKPGSVKKF